MAIALAAALSLLLPASDTLDVLLRAAERHHYRGALADAIATLAQAERLAAERGAPPARLARIAVRRADVWLSRITATNTGYAEADSAAAAARRLARESGDPRLIADAEDFTGRVLYARRINLAEGDYERPMAHFQRALDLRRKVGDTRGIVESMFRVGLIHERRDESAQAIALYEGAMRMAGERYPLERSGLTRHLAFQHLDRGELDKALDLFTRSLELRDAAGFVLTRASALTSIGDVYREKGEHGRALEFATRALREAERLGATRFVVGALISLGQTHGAAGDRAAALARLDRAEALAGEIDYVYGLTRAREERERLEPAAASRAP